MKKQSFPQCVSAHGYLNVWTCIWSWLWGSSGQGSGWVQGWMVIHALFLSTSIMLESFQVRRHFCIICFMNKDIKAERNEQQQYSCSEPMVLLTWVSLAPFWLLQSYMSKCCSPQVSCSALLLFGKILPGDILYLGVQVFPFRQPGSTEHFAAISPIRTVYSFSILSTLVHLLRVTELSPQH